MAVFVLDMIHQNPMMKLAFKHFLPLLILLLGGFGLIYAKQASHPVSCESIQLRITSGLSRLFAASDPEQLHVQQADRDHHKADRIYSEENREENFVSGFLKKHTEIPHYFSAFYPETNIYQSSLLRPGLLFRKHYSCYSSKLYIILRVIRI